jgi:hypothetical protein
MSSEENKQELMKIKANGRGVELSSIDEMYRFANCVKLSNLAPSSFKTAEQIVIAIQSGAELGMPPMRSLQSLCVINGQARLYGDAPLALVRQSGKMEFIKEEIEGENEDMAACCEVKRKGDPESSKRWFTVEDAKLAGLWTKTGPWKQYPKRMLQMRARSLALRDVFPDCFGGATIAEEYMGVEAPEPAHEVTTPRRELREDEVTITDANPLEGLITALVDKIVDWKSYQIEPEWDKELLIKILDVFAKVALEDTETDFTNPESFTTEKIARCLNHLELIGLPDDVLALIPDALEVENE